MMKLKKDHIWIALACIILGVFIAFQMKFIQGTYLDGVTPTQKTSELLTELSAVKTEKEALAEEIERLEDQLSEIQNSASNESVIIKSLTDELDRYKAFSGMTKVSGMGVVVTIDNPQQDANLGVETNIAYDYQLILDLVNELNSAGAEAISINEQRMVNSTEVRLAGTQVNVNTIPISPPFIVKAIGNSKTLDGAINQRFGIVQTIRELGYYVEVKQVETLEISAYNGSITFKYAQTVK
jgi:uncharacterized protein YlxW (UPF0749 family)